MNPLEHGVTKPSPRFFELGRMGPEDKFVLTERTRRNNGVALVLVHPFYNYGPEDEKKRTHHDSVLQVLSSTNYPVFIFEEVPVMEKTQQTLRLGGVSLPICFVPTLRADPMPLLVELLGRWRVPEERQWQAAFKKMSGLGVKTVLLGGRWYSRQNWYCVSVAESKFKQAGFAVGLTDLCYPEVPENPWRLTT